MSSNQKTTLASLVLAILLVAGIGLLTVRNNQNTSSTGNNTTTTPPTPVTVDPEKLKTEILKEGNGDQVVKAGDLLSVNYLGTLTNGTKFDSSYDRNEPYEFTIGQGDVILGWDQGLLGMKVGEKRKLTIAPEYGYGSSARSSIPANSTLIFEVELLGIQ